MSLFSYELSMTWIAVFYDLYDCNLFDDMLLSPLHKCTKRTLRWSFYARVVVFLCPCARADACFYSLF